MTPTQDMVMITPAISPEILEGEILVIVKQNIFRLRTQHVSRQLLTLIEVKNNLREGVRNIKKKTNNDFQWRWLP